MLIRSADDSVDLSWWSNIECTVSIMAASIPILRVLLKDMKKTVFTRGQYGGTSSGPKSRSKSSRKVWTQNNTEVMVTAGRDHRSRSNSEDTDGSELNILNGEVSSSSKGGGHGVIIQKSDYTVKYESRESV